MTKFVDKVLPGDVRLTREFTLQPGVEPGPDIDLIPPPNFTPMTLPFSYNYSQNPYTKEVSPGGSSPLGSEAEDDEYNRVVNVTSRVPAAGYFIAHDEYPVPSGTMAGCSGKVRSRSADGPQVSHLPDSNLQASQKSARHCRSFLASRPAQ
jgi:hypothetical protein